MMIVKMSLLWKAVRLVPQLISQTLHYMRHRPLPWPSIAPPILALGLPSCHSLTEDEHHSSLDATQWVHGARCDSMRTAFDGDCVMTPVSASYETIPISPKSICKSVASHQKVRSGKGQGVTKWSMRDIMKELVRLLWTKWFAFPRICEISQSLECTTVRPQQMLI